MTSQLRPIKSSLYRLEDDGECTARRKCTVEAVCGSSRPTASVDRQLVVRGAQTDTRLVNAKFHYAIWFDTDHQLLMATVKARLAKRQRQHSIPPLNLEELKEEKAVQFAAEVSNRLRHWRLHIMR